ncbi:4Fe-4S dicluster domain-containing protein [Persephonella sp.]
MQVILEKDQLKDIFRILKKEYTVISPVLKDNVIQLSEIENINQLPFGFIEKEEKNFYSVEKVEDDFLFTYCRPSIPYKRYLNPTEFTFLKVTKKDGNLEFIEKIPERKYAFFDIRACDLKGISILDDVFINKNPHPDPYYTSVRENLFIVAVTCVNPTNVCFCTSMELSPKPVNGFDILITELEDGLLIEIGSEKGRKLIEKLPHRKASENDLKKADEIEKNCIKKIKRNINTDNLTQIFYLKIEDHHWQEIGKRCLACTSCTQICPTCFCFDIIERNDPIENMSERVRIWDSCFNPSFATVHKFNIRQSIASRYRQWLMHKFAYWTEQFGGFGCVGCGRCITWCPAGIDLTDEIKNFRDK